MIQLFSKSFFVYLCLFLVFIVPKASAGNILIAGDDWIFTNTGFSIRPIDTANFARNVADFVTNGTGTSIHAYASHQSLTESSLKNTLNSIGYTYTTGTDITFDLPTLSQYDALFLGWDHLSSSQLDILSQYVSEGGGVYIHAGLGATNPSGEANAWNGFLSQYGLSFGTSFLYVNGPTSIYSDHRVFDGVSSLYMVTTHTVTSGGIATTSEGVPLFGAYEVPEPTTLLLLGIGAVMIRRRK